MRAIRKQSMTRTLGFAVLFLLPVSASVQAATEISDVPPFAMEGVDPNIVLTMDDSGSMLFEDTLNKGTNYAGESYRGYNYIDYTPDNETERLLVCRGVNLQAYDPTVTYTPWAGTDEDGNPYPNLSLTTARFNPYYTDSGNIRDISNHTYFEWNDADGDGEYDSGECGNTSSNDYGVAVSSLSPAEQTNYANFWSYYRKREYIAKNAASKAFENLPEKFRVGYQGFNQNTNIGDLLPFSGSNRSAFIDKILSVDIQKHGTPLRAAVDRAGTKFTESKVYRDDPASSSGPLRACRQNFNILLTDGFWNGSFSDIGNVDGTSESDIPTNDYGISEYSPSVKPEVYSDSWSSTLADLAFLYWKTDLRDDLEDDVPTYIVDKTSDINGDGVTNDFDIFWNPKNNPAKWQHMVNFTIGMGVEGLLEFDQMWSGGDYSGLLDGTVDWPQARVGADQENIDDLWHAAINSRGQYFSARDPQSLVNAFADVLSNILERQGSASTVSLNSAILEAGTLAYQSGFNSSDWTGELSAYPIAFNGAPCDRPDGQVCPSPSWQASGLLDDKNWDSGRQIITYDPGTGSGAAFRWNSLDGTQQTELDLADGLGSERLKYLRGDSSNEGSLFRSRNTRLGDIINGSPFFAGSPSLFYEETFSDYATFKSTNAGRTPVVYVGANDGMLHAFHAETGQELLAYVPNAVYPNLADLTGVDYVHKNYVDGRIRVADVRAGGWKTVLLGSLGLGGNSVYALDVTNPAGFSEANAANIVMWEFSDAEMGTLIQAPREGLLNNGDWAAIFPSGFNSPSGKAALYLVNISDGSLIKRIEIDVADNGIADIALHDEDGNYTVDYVYAGDLHGNIWKFDLSSSNDGQWKLDFNGDPLFQATDGSGNPQPITTAVVTGEHPRNEGRLVLFGTGRYLSGSDVVDTQTQTFYAIWDEDDNNPSISRSDLLQQHILGTYTDRFSNTDARVTSNYQVDWDQHKGWYMDLDAETGERVHQSPFLRSGRVIFATVTPSDDPCTAGGTSWIYEMDLDSGSRLNDTPFDYDDSGHFDQGDFLPGGIDIDEDGTVDVIVYDDNRDGTLDDSDLTAYINNHNYDANGDGVIDMMDLQFLQSMDTNGDGQVDENDVIAGTAIRKPDTGVNFLDEEGVIIGEPPNEYKNVSTSGGQMITVLENNPALQQRSWRELIMGN